MKEIKTVIAYGAMLISSVIGFIGAILVISFDPADFILNIAGFFGIGMFALFIFSIVLLYQQIDEGEKDIARDNTSNKKD